LCVVPSDPVALPDFPGINVDEFTSKVKSELAAFNFGLPHDLDNDDVTDHMNIVAEVLKQKCIENSGVSTSFDDAEV
jgi:hypothetical protein